MEIAEPSLTHPSITLVYWHSTKETSLFVLFLLTILLSYIELFLNVLSFAIVKRVLQHYCFFTDLVLMTLSAW